MDSNKARILLVDDDSEATLSLARGIRAAGLVAEVRAAPDREKALAVLREFDPQAAVIDLNLNPKEGVESGFAVLREILAASRFCRVIVLTGNAGVENGVRALNSGAASFLEKPADLNHLCAIVKDCVRQSNIRRDYEALRERGERPDIGSLIIGESQAIERVKEAVLYAASNSQPVLIAGETGSGKGLCALAVHRFSSRHSGRFVRYQPNFGSADLVNSDLFGHIKGSFTGAHNDRKGLIAEANHGTLFLDEIDELPPETQVALLGVLQDRRFRALGSDKEQEINFRLVIASNRDIEECLKNGKLRKDFYHRAAHIEIRIPPLRERLEDIEVLSRFMLESLAEKEEVHVFDMEASAIERLKKHSWPGNVRELQSVVEGAAFKAQFRGGSAISVDDITIKGDMGVSPGGGGSFNDRVREFKLKLINEALVRSGGNQVRAAEDLGLDRSTMRRILARDGE